MPVIDKPLEELQVYNGINPRPDDFSEYWDAALAEMRSVDADVDIPEAEFQAPIADCRDLYFTGVGGSRVHAQLLIPRTLTAPAPAVIMFHGYTGHAGDWSEKLGYVGAGFVVAALDCRGQAGLSEDLGGVTGNTHQGHIIRGLDDAPEKLLFRQIYLDTAQLTGIVMSLDQIDENRVGVTGGSQGGGLTLACAALEPRVKRAAPVFPFLCDYRRVWEMDLAERAYREIRDFFRRFDPLHEREDEIFTRLGYIDVQHLAPRIEAEVLLFTGLMDEVCPPSTQFAAYNKITSKKDIVIYLDFGHEGLPGHTDKIYSFLMGL